MLSTGSLGTTRAKQLEDIPYRAFSGANIYATVGTRRLGALQALTVSITREVAALYSFSDANPKAFVKGKRGIAGSLVFTQFDRHALLNDVFADLNGKTLRESGQGVNALTTRFVNPNIDNPLFQETGITVRNFTALNRVDAGQGVPGGIGQNVFSEIHDIYEMVARQRLKYSDQLPEFDITVTMVNEDGQAAFAVVGGVVLVNEGWGYTLDDLTSEVAFTYVARSISPLASLNNTQLFTQGR